MGLTRAEGDAGSWCENRQREWRNFHAGTVLEAPVAVHARDYGLAAARVRPHKPRFPRWPTSTLVVHIG